MPSTLSWEAIAARWCFSFESFKKRALSPMAADHGACLLHLCKRLRMLRHSQRAWVWTLLSILIALLAAYLSLLVQRYSRSRLEAKEVARTTTVWRTRQLDRFCSWNHNCPQEPNFKTFFAYLLGVRFICGGIFRLLNLLNRCWFSDLGRIFFGFFAFLALSVFFDVLLAFAFFLFTFCFLLSFLLQF